MVSKDPILWAIVAALAVAVAVAIAIVARRRDRLAVPPARVAHQRVSPGLTPVGARARARYAGEWSALEARFAEAPVEALRAAERLVGSIMRDRGFPYLDPQQRPEAIEPIDAEASGEYADALEVVNRLDNGSRVAAEELRRAIADYRTVVRTLLAIAAGETARESG